MQNFVFDRYYFSLVMNILIAGYMLFCMFQKDHKSIVIFTMSKRTVVKSADRFFYALIVAFVIFGTAQRLIKGNETPQTESIVHFILTIIFFVQMPAVAFLLSQRKPYWVIVAPLLTSLIGLFIVIHYFKF